jgi:hypothetical protein
MKHHWSFLGLGLAFTVLGASAKADTVGEIRMTSYIKYNDPSVLATNHMMMMKINLKVNGEIDPLAPSADNEIEGHGHYDYTVSGTTEDSLGKCKFTSLWYQENGPLKTTKQLLDSGVDSNPHWNSIKLCSGLVMKFQSVRKLMLAGSTQKVSIYIKGNPTAFAEGDLEMKEAPKPQPKAEDDSNDPWHRDH